MRYWILDGRERRGPFEPAELVRAPGFDPSSLVCPEGKRLGERHNWKPARKFPEIRAAVQARSRPREPVGPASTPAPVVRTYALAPTEPPPPKIAAVEAGKDLAAPAPEIKVRAEGLFAADRIRSWGAAAAFAGALACFLVWFLSSRKEAPPSSAAILPSPLSTAPPNPGVEEPLARAVRYAGSDSPSFTDLREVLAGVTQDPVVAPLAEEFALRFSAEAALWERYLDFALAARRGESRLAVAFIKPLMRSPEFRELDLRLSRKPAADAAVRVLADSPALKAFWAQWHSQGVKPAPVGAMSGSLQLLEGCKLTALLASRASGGGPAVPLEKSR